MVERQSAQVSKITTDGLTRSRTWMLYSCTHMATVGVLNIQTWFPLRVAIYTRDRDRYNWRQLVETERQTSLYSAMGLPQDDGL